jgi:hypothetical protein
MTISKSNYVAGVQCLKRFYFQVHEPELAAEPDASDHGIMEQGLEVGMLARRLFPGGIEVSSEGGLEQAIRTTSALVASPEVPARRSVLRSTRCSQRPTAASLMSR